jgi:hypothetical protein
MLYPLAKMLFFVVQSTDDTWWLGEDAWLLLNSVPLGSPWLRVISGSSRGERSGLGATGCMVVRTQPRPGAGAGCHETRGDLRPDSGSGGGGGGGGRFEPFLVP